MWSPKTDPCRKSYSSSSAAFFVTVLIACKPGQYSDYINIRSGIERNVLFPSLSFVRLVWRICNVQWIKVSQFVTPLQFGLKTCMRFSEIALFIAPAYILTPAASGRRTRGGSSGHWRGFRRLLLPRSLQVNASCQAHRYCSDIESWWKLLTTVEFLSDTGCLVVFCLVQSHYNNTITIMH